MDKDYGDVSDYCRGSLLQNCVVGDINNDDTLSSGSVKVYVWCAFMKIVHML